MMKYPYSLTAPAIALMLLVCAGIASPTARAEIEHARDLMEANRFEEAMAELWPAARSGNADAEELIGVMYAPWDSGSNRIIVALLNGICDLR